MMSGPRWDKRPARDDETCGWGGQLGGPECGLAAVLVVTAEGGEAPPGAPPGIAEPLALCEGHVQSWRDTGAS